LVLLEEKEVSLLEKFNVEAAALEDPNIEDFDEPCDNCESCERSVASLDPRLFVKFPLFRVV
jgi:hypothetical protein